MRAIFAMRRARTGASAATLASTGASTGASDAAPVPSRAEFQRALRRRVCCALVLLAIAAAPEVHAQEDPPASRSQDAKANPILVYLPNRIFDLFDVVRARVRVGPGVAVGARVTEAVDVGFGAYTSLFAGIPGPRKRPRWNLPVGFESFAGLEVSGVEATAAGDDEPYGPEYGAVEVGAGFQLALVGLDLGLDVEELLDFLAGIVAIDLVDDDL